MKKLLNSVDVTLTVAECSEFHDMGVFYDGVTTVDEAITLWNNIPKNRMNAAPAIGINLHTGGSDPLEDIRINILSGSVVDLDILNYVPQIKNTPEAMEVIAELISKLPNDIEIIGAIKKEEGVFKMSKYREIKSVWDIPKGAVYYAKEVEGSKMSPGNRIVVDFYDNHFNKIERTKNVQISRLLNNLKEIVRNIKFDSWVNAHSFFATVEEAQKCLKPLNNDFYIVDKEEYKKLQKSTEKVIAAGRG